MRSDAILANDLRSAAADRQLLFHQQVFGDQAALFERARHDQQEVVGIHRLGEEVERALLHRGNRILDAAVCGHHDDRNVQIEFLGRAQDAEAISFRQAQIGQHQRGLVLQQHPDSFRLIGRLEHAVALTLEGMAQHRAQRVFVLDDEDLGGGSQCNGW